MWTEEGRKGGGKQCGWMSVEDSKNVREEQTRDGRRKTCRGRDVCISENGERRRSSQRAGLL